MLKVGSGPSSVMCSFHSAGPAYRRKAGSPNTPSVTLIKTSANTEVQRKRDKSKYSYILECVVLLPEKLDAKHWINNSSLVHFSNGADPLVLRVRADSLPNIGSNDTDGD